jgi:hypothetical protein
MANPDHLNTLRQGVDAWNALREGNPDIIPGLRKADLFEADLSGAHLCGADLSGANLSRADITNAELTGCRVYSVSAWDVKLTSGTRQQDLVITPLSEPEVNR